MLLTLLTGALIQWLYTPPEPSFVASPVVEAVESQSLPPSAVLVAETAPLTEKQEIMSYIVEVFGDDADDAIALVGQCENKGWNPQAVNHNKNGSRDLGIFQLNDRYHGGEENFDWKTNIDKAYKIFSRQGWTPWSCAWVIGHTPFYAK